jgi:hypothetical protein
MLQSTGPIQQSSQPPSQEGSGDLLEFARIKQESPDHLPAGVAWVSSTSCFTFTGFHP